MGVALSSSALPYLKYMFGHCMLYSPQAANIIHPSCLITRHRMSLASRAAPLWPSIDPSKCQNVNTLVQLTHSLSSTNDDNSFQIQIHKFSGSVDLWAAKSKTKHQLAGRSIQNIVVYLSLSLRHVIIGSHANHSRYWCSGKWRNPKV